MDTLAMAVRSFLLIVVTGAFVALWSGDVPDQIAVIDRRANIRFDKRDSNPESQIKVYESSDGDVAPSASAPVFRIYPNAPLPEDITPGTYMIVDQSGRSEMRVITGRDRVSYQPSRNHYSIESGNSRWHYIRVDASEIQRTALTHSTESALQ